MTKFALVSVVIPVLNESACLRQLHAELRGVCDRLPYAFEFVFVDDGSTDATADVLRLLSELDERVRYLVLSRNFGHQPALSAGIAHTSGSAVIMMDGDLQHPPGLIPTLLERWRAGSEIVNTVRLGTEDISESKKFFSRLFYRVFNLLANVEIEPGNADFRLMSRAAVDVLNELPERHRFLRGLIPWIGFRQTRVEYQAPARWAGQSKYTFLKNIRFALEGITAFSFFPLRLVTMFGSLIAVSSLVYGLAAVGSLWLGGRNVPGWTSLLCCVLFFGGSQLVVLGIIGEYQGRTLEQVKGRPLYIVRATGGFTGPHGRQRAIPAPHWSRSGAPSVGARVDETSTGSVSF
jgi:polyisoprenyl-phosphate glycosyltransferase